MGSIKLFCEIFVKKYAAAVRAMLTRVLIDKYSMSQVEIAERLGITQGAVSQYYNNIRGANSKLGENEKIKALIDEIASQVVKNEYNEARICEICNIIRSEIEQSNIECKVQNAQVTNPQPQ